MTDTNYTITTMDRCRIVQGAVPISAFASLSKGFSENAVMAIDIASRIGASFVIGEPEDIEILRQRPLPTCPIRIQEASQAKQLQLPESLVNWLLTGNRGASSNAMYYTMFDIPEQDEKMDHPWDPADFRRCLEFLDAAGLENRYRLEKLSSLSPEWTALIARWDELTRCFTEERETNLESKTAPKTYVLMQAIFEDVRQSAGPSN
jgi:hypothetical protein